MSPRRHLRPSPALAVAMVALLVSVSGVATALPGKNSVAGNDIKKNAVKSKHIKDEKVKGRDLASGAVGARQFGNVTAVVDGSPATFNGGGGQNGIWNGGESTASCPGDAELIGGSAEFIAPEGVNEELAIKEVVPDFEADSITARGISDIAADRQFRAIAYCLG